MRCRWAQRNNRFRSVSIIALLPTLPIPLRLNCRRFPLPKCLPFGSPHAALSVWLWPPESFPHCHRRLESAASVFASNLCTRPVRSTLWAPICGRPSTTPQALGLPLLVHNLCGRPILYLVGHKRPPSSDYRRTPAQSRCCGGSAMASVHICVAFRQAWRGIEPIASGT